MDKYELNIKVEQIKKLAAKKAYKEAAAIAKEMNWQKVRDWAVLATVINVQEAVGDFEEARDMAILAYNRNLGGRKLVYKLTELLIKLQDFENAEALYEEYEKMSSHDVNRFILYYDLRKAQQASENELVEILEDYKEHEIDEKYMYELARLYSGTGRYEECIKTCDDIVLWFQDGIYVEKAIQLKQELGATLTNTQKKIFESAAARSRDLEAAKEQLFEQQQELVRIQHDDIEEALKEEVPEEEPAVSASLAALLEEAAAAPALEEEAKEAGQTNTETQEPDGTADEILLVDTREAAAEPLRMPETLRELIANAKKKIENSYDQMNREEEEEQLLAEEEEARRRIRAREDAMDIAVDVPNYNLYDTQNIQAELAKNLSDLLDEEETAELFRPRPNTQAAVPQPQEAAAEEPEDGQIEGQLSLADWIETVREEKYGKQNTKEYSKAELNRMLDEKDEKSAAYEKLMAEQKALALAAGKEFNEAKARVKARAQMMLHAAKTDLAIRTGKATLKQEETISEMRKASAKTAARPQEKPYAEALAAEQEYTATVDIPAEEEDMVTLDTAPVKTVTDEILQSIAKSVTEKDESKPAEALEESAVGELFEPERPRKLKPVREKPVQPVVDDMDLNIDETKKLSGDLAKLFRKYREMPGLESQLVDYFNACPAELQLQDSSRGNIIISGNSSSDKTDLARAIVRAINYLYPDRPKKIAKTTGDSINHRGIAKAMSKLKGTALIVEGAGTIQPKRIHELLACLDQDTDRMLVIFEDSDAEMNVLLNFNPELADKFNHRIVLKQYTVNELVEMARKFARKRQYEVDDDALLELYLKIDKLHNMSDNIKLDDIKEIINQAIVKSEKRASRKFFGGLKKKRGENGDIFFLSEADFKD